MINIKRKLIKRKIALNPFIPELYKQDFKEKYGNKVKDGNIYPLPGFINPVRIYKTSKEIESTGTVGVVLIEMNNYIITEYNDKPEYGMIFKYIDGVTYMILKPEQIIAYGDIVSWKAELQVYEDAD